MTAPMETDRNRIRVAFLARSLEATGGAEQQLAHIALGLDSRQFDCRVYCFYETGELCHHLRAGGIKIESLHKSSRWDLFRPSSQLHRKLREFRPHVLHSFLGPPNVLAALLKPFFPGMRVVWGVRASDMRLENYDWTRRATFRAEVLLSRIPDIIVANAEAGRRHVTAAGFPERRVSVVHNGIDTQRFRSMPGMRAAIRNELGLKSDAPIIGMIARIDPQKDHDTFLQAARLAVTRKPDLQFLCIGGGDPALMDRLTNLTNLLGLNRNVHWIGERKDIPELINSFDLLTLTSAYGEGFPNAVGEAMACGCPCVVTDVGDCAAIVGNTGFVAERGDAKALSQYWLDYFALPDTRRQEIGRNARQRIETQYSLAAMVKQSEHLYGTVAHSPLLAV